VNETKSDLSLRNAVVIGRPDGKDLFTVIGGNVKANLDGYLVVPAEIFTPQQIKAALNKYMAQKAPPIKGP